MLRVYGEPHPIFPFPLELGEIERVEGRCPCPGIDLRFDGLDAQIGKSHPLTPTDDRPAGLCRVIHESLPGGIHTKAPRF